MTLVIGGRVFAPADRPVLNQRRSRKMKQNEYNAAEAVEIGKAEDVILGVKTDIPALDSTANPPEDRLWVE